jgi:di-N-acetylchitobiase
LLFQSQKVYGKKIPTIHNLNISLFSDFEVESLQNCPCKSSHSEENQIDFRLCLPIDFITNIEQKNLQQKHKKEVYVFSPVEERKSWKYYDWEQVSREIYIYILESSTLLRQVTTVAWNEDKELLCHAHKKGAKIVIKHNFDEVKTICTIEARKKWIQV